MVVFIYLFTNGWRRRFIFAVLLGLVGCFFFSLTELFLIKLSSVGMGKVGGKIIFLPS